MTSSTATSMSMTDSTAAAAASSTAASMSGMDMGGGSDDGPICKISMLWNWYTIDACFLSSTWHVSSSGVFAVGCIGVTLLVVALEFLRRVGKAYDVSILAQFRRRAESRVTESTSEQGPTHFDAVQSFRYTPLQQIIRSLIHMTTFAVAYFIMLLAMYFNGYIIISIFAGAFLGKLVCDWKSIEIPVERHGDAVEERQELTKGEQELTYCCG